MIEGKRQKQVCAVLEKDLNEIFQRLGLSMMDGGMISISGVKITPDLFDARIYLSFFKVKDPVATLQAIQERSSKKNDDNTLDLSIGGDHYIHDTEGGGY